MMIRVALVFLALVLAFTAWVTYSRVIDLNSRLTSLEEADIKEVKLIGDLTSLMEAFNQDGKDLRETVDEVVVQRQEMDGRWDEVGQYAEAVAIYYAVLVLTEVDPRTVEKSVLKITEAVAFDPMLSAMWKAAQLDPEVFYLFDTVLYSQFYKALAEAMGHPAEEVKINSGFNKLAPRSGDRNG